MFTITIKTISTPNMTLIQLMILCKHSMAKTNNIIIITIFQHMTSLKISQHIWRVPFNTFFCLFLFWLICLQDTCAPSSWKRQYISICLGSKHINFYSCLAPLHSLSNISAGSRMCESRPAWINNQSQKREICETINEEKWLRIQSLLHKCWIGISPNKDGVYVAKSWMGEGQRRAQHQLIGINENVK